MFTISRVSLLILSLSFMCTSIQSLAAPSQATHFPPSVDLLYKINTVHKGFPISGEAKIAWRLNDDQQGNSSFNITTNTTASFFGSIHSTKSVGSVRATGLFPTEYSEKRIRRASSTTLFDYEKKRITISNTDSFFKLNGGEQDKTSAIWQLVGLVRSTDIVTFQSQKWPIRVVGKSDIDTWVFNVIGKVTINTALGELECLHISRSTFDSKDQQVELWLAIKHDFYPVQMTFLEQDGEQITQKIAAINPI